MSKLPPLTTQHTFLFRKRPSFRTAATTVADEGSITIFILQSTNWVASIIQLQLTKIMSSLFKCQFRIAKVNGPKLVRRPSAIETGGSWPTIYPFYRDILASLARQGSTPTGLHFPPKYLVLNTHPLLNPPPPIGNTKQSKSFSSSKTSFAAVAWPAMMSKSLQGCTKNALFYLHTLYAVSSLSFKVFQDQMTFPPQPMTPFFLTVGEFLGMTMQDDRLRVVAAYANACA